MKTHSLQTWLLSASVALVAGCAFDIVHVKQIPATFAPVSETPQSFVLRQDVKATLGTGFPTRLKKDTQWHQVGITEYGLVFATRDQIVTVEASNIHEAQLVVSNRFISGFYLPVEKKFTPVTQPISIENSTNIKTP